MFKNNMYSITRCCNRSHFTLKDVFIYFSRGVKLKLQAENDRKIFMKNCFEKADADIEVFLRKNKKFLEHDTNHIESVIGVGKKFNFTVDQLFLSPKIFGFQAGRIENHANLLMECGFDKVQPSHILYFISLVTKKSISLLKHSGLIMYNLNVHDNLIKCLKKWPTSPAMDSPVNEINTTLHDLRMAILASYLELNVGLPIEEFQNKVKTYPRIKHRPLKLIEDLLDIFQNQLGLSNEKIQSNFGIFQADPKNIHRILIECDYLADMDIKEIIHLRPSILNVNCSSILKIRDMLDEYGISKEVQKKGFQVYFFSPETVKERIENIKNSPEYSAYFHHPRMLKLLYSKKRADKRLDNLIEQNKKCISLNVLSGCNKHYQSYAQSTGDRTRGRDTINTVCAMLDDQFSYEQVRTALKKNNFLTKVPLSRIETVHRHLKNDFDSKEIFANCQILLYPLESVKKYLNLLFQCRNIPGITGIQGVIGRTSLDSVNLNNVTNSVVLSLVLYLIDKDHHFSDDGVWASGKK